MPEAALPHSRMQVKIYWINYEESGGIGIMPRPRGGDWLDDEMRSLRASGVEVVVSLLESQEVAELDLGQEQAVCKVHAMEYISFPISDRSVPSSRAGVESLSDRLAEFISEGKKVVIHCRQGIGRSAIIAACVLAERGMSVDEAFERIAQARGCPVPDTPKQRKWVDRFVKDSS